MAATEDNPKISTTFGIKNDVFRIVASQLLCYLLGIVYNKLFVKRSVEIKHIFNVVSGLLIVYYNFGFDAGHSLATIIASWTIMKLLGPTRTMVAVNFTFVSSYLLYGYYLNKSSHSTTFTWTLPQCVLTLSLIAQGFDIYDGRVNVVNKAKGGQCTNEDTALESAPTLLETLSKSYFPSVVLIGPQLRFKDFLVFIQSKENLLPFCWKQSIFRMCLGVLYFAVYQTGLSYLPSSYFTSEAFKSYNLLAKLCLLAFHNKVVLCKYLSAWLLSEGGCIMSGISRDPASGEINRCFNINVTLYETTTTFGGLIESFNMTTNQFAFRYIFKRLKFLNSKLLSQFMTLLFLSIWHGFSLGYYNTFALEMAIMVMEKDIGNIVSKQCSRNPKFKQFLDNSIVRCLLYIAMRLHVILMFSYAFTSFGFLEYENWTVILGELYWIGHFIYFSWMLISPFI